MNATSEELPETTRPPYRVGRETLRGDAWMLALMAADFLLGLWSLTWLPARVPVHFGLDGTPDRWGPAWQNALLLPAIGVVVYLLLLFLPLIDPKRANYALFSETARFFRGAVVVFMVGVHVAVLLTSIGHGPRMDLMMRIGLPLLFAALGNRMGTLRPNWFFGVRVPWTLASEEVWRRTHRMAARLWVAGGLVLLAAAALPVGLGLAILVGGLVLLSLAPIVYSWRLFESLRKTSTGQ